MLKSWIVEKHLACDYRQDYANARPFPHLVLKDFFIKEKIERVRRALLKQSFERRESDLFSFWQTKGDVAGLQDPVLREFYGFFSSREFLDFVARLTGMKVSNIDMSGFVYGDADYLLPHDDRLEGRKIAYVVNLSKGFKKVDGGALSFFSVKNGRPVRVVKSFVPTFNTLFLFGVSERSFHQVDEVLSKKKRVTLAGWFHD